MSNKSILNVKIPYLDESMKVEDAYNYLAKAINSAKISETSSVEMSGADIAPSEVSVSQSFSAGAGSLFANFVIPHSLGVVPSGYSLIDMTISPFFSTMNYTLHRISWTTTNITVRLNLTTSTGTAFSGNFKLLILR